MSTETSGSSKVLSQGVISMLAYGVNFIAVFFASIGMMRIMGKAPFGMFSIVIQVVAFTAMIADFGIGPVIMRRLAIAPGRSAGIMLEATYARLLLMVPAWLITMVIGWQLDPSREFFVMLNLMLCNMLISSKLPVLRGTLESLYRSQSRMAFPIITMALDAIVLLALVVVLPQYFHDPVDAMMLYTASNLIGAVVLVVSSVSYARRLSTEPVHVTWEGMRELLIASSPLAAFLLLNALHISIDTVYLKLFHGNEQAGVFNAALRVMTPLAVYPTIIAISAAPYIARMCISDTAEQRERMSQLVSLSLKTLLVGSVLLAGFGMTNAQILMDFAGNYKYDDAVLPIIILFILFLPMSLNLFFVELNNARGRTIINTRAAAVLAFTSVVAGIPLIISYAATGAALAKLTAAILGLAFLSRHSREGITFAMKPVVFKAALLLAVLIGVRVGLDNAHFLLSNGAALLAVSACMFALRIFSSDELLRWKEQIGGLFGRTR